MLLMKKRFFEAIRSGRKTMTVRYWRHQRLRPGQVHSVRGLGHIRIDRVRVVNLSELTDADAAADGFASAAEMRAALRAMYPDLACQSAQPSLSDGRSAEVPQAGPARATGSGGPHAGRAGASPARSGGRPRSAPKPATPAGRSGPANRRTLFAVHFTFLHE